jgi:hypothetical protein
MLSCRSGFSVFIPAPEKAWRRKERQFDQGIRWTNVSSKLCSRTLPFNIPPFVYGGEFNPKSEWRRPFLPFADVGTSVYVKDLAGHVPSLC